jgi:hypothetical protein
MRVTALDGGTQITVQLSPQSLGRVDIRIDRAPDGLAQVSLTVARPETLALLVRDQTQLNDALDRAGVPGDQRVLSFHLAPADAGSQTAPPVAASNGTQTQERSDHQQTAPDTAFQGHGGSSDRPTGDGTPRQGARPAFPFGTALPDDAGPVDWTPPSGWHRTGLNITA